MVLLVMMQISYSTIQRIVQIQRQVSLSHLRNQFMETRRTGRIIQFLFLLMVQSSVLQMISVTVTIGSVLVLVCMVSGRRRVEATCILTLLTVVNRVSGSTLWD